MRQAVLAILLACMSSVQCIAQDYSPFADPLLGLSAHGLLIKRQNNCQSGYNSCANLNEAGACCPPNTNCARDQVGNIACCPVGAFCTGTIRGTASASGTSSGGFVLGGTTTTTTSSSPSPTTNPGVEGGGSTVPNNFFPFIYIPTSYANADLCTSAFSSCQTASTSCFVSLAGQNGVTVSGFGGGVTVQGASGTVITSASSICSSLSQEGCYGLQETQCANFGTGGGPAATQTTGFVQVGNSGPRQTACPGMVYAAGAGVVVGAVQGLL